MGAVPLDAFTVKSCGNAHAWCSKCRPDVAEGQRKPKPPPKPGMPRCRNCGSCDYCLGLTAPEGMKVCRKCGETKPLGAFYRRPDTGSYRNQCMKCRDGHQEAHRCENCGKWFPRRTPERTLCADCRPVLRKRCAQCGVLFVGSRDQRIYCSAECRDVALKSKRNAKHKVQRLEALQAYGGLVPACACCGETVLLFLALDHVNGGGGKQHRELGGGGFYSWLRKNNYPAGFQVLCHNCNLGRQLNGGVCPHKQGEPS